VGPTAKNVVWSEYFDNTKQIVRACADVGLFPIEIKSKKMIETIKRVISDYTINQ
jgi:hypothetical protein